MSETRLVVILAYEGVNLIDLAGPLQAFEGANRLSPPGAALPYRLVVASAKGGPVITGPRLPVLTVPIAEVEAEAVDTLIVPGGSFSGAPPHEPELVEFLHAVAAGPRRLCSVCSGAFLLAEAGALVGRRVTTHWNWARRLARLHPDIQVDADPIFIQDGRLWTSAGVTAGIDLALALIEADLGHADAISVARDLVVFMKRPGGQSQFSAPLRVQSREAPGFAALHAWMADNLDGDLRVECLAAQAGMSPRSFARHYAAQMGQTPARTVEMMRLEAARRALEGGSQPVKRIAAQAGFGDEQALRRAFLRQLGIGPTQYRSRFSAHGSAETPERLAPRP